MIGVPNGTGTVRRRAAPPNMFLTARGSRWVTQRTLGRVMASIIGPQFPAGNRHRSETNSSPTGGAKRLYAKMRRARGFA
jgi:hypothetical protein